MNNNPNLYFEEIPELFQSQIIDGAIYKVSNKKINHIFNKNENQL